MLLVGKVVLGQHDLDPGKPWQSVLPELGVFELQDVDLFASQQMGDLPGRVLRGEKSRIRRLQAPPARLVSGLPGMEVDGAGPG